MNTYDSHTIAGQQQAPSSQSGRVADNSTHARFTAENIRPMKDKMGREYHIIDLFLPSGMIVAGCTVHRKPDGSRWVGVPAKSYDKAGKVAWARVIDFAAPAAKARFERLALEAFDAAMANGGAA